PLVEGSEGLFRLPHLSVSSFWWEMGGRDTGIMADGADAFTASSTCNEAFFQGGEILRSVRRRFVDFLSMRATSFSSTSKIEVMFQGRFREALWGPGGS
ncbi:hypothetical protein CDAR_386681, partial [Caerostris darwini]